jgi:hypothetical protein
LSGGLGATGLGATGLGAAVSTGGGIDGLGAVAVSLGGGGGLLLAPVSAGVAGGGGAAWLGGNGGRGRGPPSSLGSTNSTLMASGLPSRSPSWRGRDRPALKMALACSSATQAKPIQNLCSGSRSG